MNNFQRSHKCGDQNMKLKHLVLGSNANTLLICTIVGRMDLAVGYDSSLYFKRQC